MTALQAPRPNRHARRVLAANPALDLGIKSGHSPPPVPPQPGQPVQVGLKFGRTSTHMVMVVCLGPNEVPMPMTPDQWEQLKVVGDEQAEAVRAGAPEPEPEPAPAYDDDEAVLIRTRAEECAIAYGKFVMDPHTALRAFRHPNHLANWAAKHKLDMEPDEATGGVVFYPVAVIPTENLL